MFFAKSLGTVGVPHFTVYTRKDGQNESIKHWRLSPLHFDSKHAAHGAAAIPHSKRCRYQRTPIQISIWVWQLQPQSKSQPPDAIMMNTFLMSSWRMNMYRSHRPRRRFFIASTWREATRLDWLCLVLPCLSSNGAERAACRVATAKLHGLFLFDTL